MHMYPVNDSATRAVQLRWSWRRGQARAPAADRAAAIIAAVLPEVPDGASTLPGVVQLDDLRRLEEPRGLLSELHHQHGTD